MNLELTIYANELRDLVSLGLAVSLAWVAVTWVRARYGRENR